jgi:hypothetical protein
VPLQLLGGVLLGFQFLLDGGVERLYRAAEGGMELLCRLVRQVRPDAT